MNTQVVKSSAVKALAAGAMLAATAPFAAVADEGKSTSDYVQDGLVAQWDGVENAGVGLHEDSPSAWVDIVGGLEITIPEWVTVETNAFYSESSTATRTYPSISSIPGLGNDVTIEVVAERVMWRDKNNYKNLQRIMSSPYTKFGYRESSTAGVFYQMPIGTNNKLWLYTSTSGSFNVSECHTYTARVTMPRDESNTLLVDAATVPGWAKEGSDGMPTDPPTNWTFFDALRADIRIYAIRVYNRKLTDAEVTANAAVDHVRFVEGKISDNRLNSALDNVSTNSANLVWSLVTSADPAPTVTARFVSGREPDLSDGVIRSLGTISANTVVTSAVTFARYATTYWRLEAEDSNGKSYVLATKTVPAFSLDSTSYVSSGLVAQWDGIDNVGRGVHSAAPTVWKDLVGSGDVTIPYWVEVRDNSLVSVGDTVTRTAPTLSSIAGITGDDVTIEVVARRVRWTKTDNYLNLQSVISSPWGDFGYRLQYDNRFFSLLPPNGSNVTQTRLYNIIDSSNLATMRQTMSARITRNSTDAVNDFVISGAKATLNYDNTHTGTLPSVWTFFNNTRTEVEFFAIRVYNRRLTDEELAANAAIDQRRFVDFGEGPLQVKYDGPGASCRREYNCWPIPGARFTCPVPRPVADGAGASVCVGWTLFAETGDNVWTEEAHGTNCEMSYLNDGRRHRLVWHTASSRDLPGGYVRLESIEAHGGQLVDTGYSPNYTTHVTFDLQFDGTFVPDAKSAFFGASDSGSPNYFIFTANFSGGTAASSGWSLYFWTQKSYNHGGTIKNMTASQATVKSRNIFDIDMETGVAKYGAYSLAISKRTADQTQSETVKIFGREVPFNSYPTMRLFGATFADGSTLRRELVPARSTETGLRGLYDYVTGSFYTNIVENGADFDGTAGGGLYVDGEPARLGEPTIPYGCNSLESGVAFELAATNTVNEGKSYFVKSIARYSFNETTGQWTLVDRTNGRKTAAAYSGEPVKYVLEWERSPGFVFIVH